MALETEIKMSLPAGAARRLPAHRLLADSKPLRQQLVNTYYDTPTGAFSASVSRYATARRAASGC
jgi:inorganic triphosphatase YgiF